MNLFNSTDDQRKNYKSNSVCERGQKNFEIILLERAFITVELYLILLEEMKSDTKFQKLLIINLSILVSAVMARLIEDYSKRCNICIDVNLKDIYTII